MASYGFYMKNGSNEVMIDGAYQNFHLAGTGTAWTAWKEVLYTGMNATEVALTGDAQFPLVALRPTSTQPVAIWNYIISNGLVVGFRVASMSAAVGVPYAVFRRTITAPVVPYGLVVKNAANQVVYHSGAIPFKINWVYTTYPKVTPPAPTRILTPVNVTVADADNNYFLLLPFASEPYADLTRYMHYSYGTTWLQVGRYVPTIHRVNSTTVQVGLYCPAWHAFTLHGTTPAVGAWEPTIQLIEVEV